MTECFLPSIGICKIFEIRDEDFTAYRELAALVCGEGRYFARLDLPSLEESKQILARCRMEKSPFLVASVDGNVVGWCHLLRRDRPVFRHCALLGMAIHPDFRGKGLGKCLFQTVIEAARESDIERIELEVFSKNESAVNLYRRCGFKLEGARERGWKCAADYDDVLIMAMFI